MQSAGAPVLYLGATLSLAHSSTTHSRPRKSRTRTQALTSRQDTCTVEAAKHSLLVGDAIDNETVLLEVDTNPEQMRTERPGEGPFLRHLLGVVDHLSVEESSLLAAHERVY